MSKKIKTTNIDPNKLITKAAYAKKMGVSQPAVSKWVESGKVTVVVAIGAELIHE